jgi:hypothetical protein
VRKRRSRSVGQCNEGSGGGGGDEEPMMAAALQPITLKVALEVG